MRSQVAFWCLLLALTSVVEVEVHGATVVCQYASWAVYRSPGGKFTPDQIDPSLCTHGVYVFAGLNTSDSVVSLDPWADLQTGGGLGGYKKFTSLKEIEPNFKAILALGGWANSATQYSAIAADPARRVKLAESALAFVKRYEFDGMEIDWLYPVTPNEKTNFALLMAEIKKVFEPEGLIILATVAPLEETVNNGYDLEALAESVDYFIMLGYDYEGSWNPETGLSSPLYRDNSSLCVDATVQLYLSNGVDPGQLLLGFPGYGHTYTLASATENGIGEPIIGPGDSGPYTQTAGILSYNEISADNGWTVERDELSDAPYAYKGNQWVSYDDAISAKIKAEYAKSNDLAGAAIWTVDEDKFVNGTFTLLRAIIAGLA